MMGAKQPESSVAVNLSSMQKLSPQKTDNEQCPGCKETTKVQLLDCSHKLCTGCLER